MSDQSRKQQEGRFELEDLKRVILVGVHPSGGDTTECKESLEELAALAETYGFEVAKTLPCPIKQFNARTYIGIGKAEEIGRIMEEEGIHAAIFDHEITPNQQKNLEFAIGFPVLDRTELILEVFAQRAETKEAVLQIEVAKIRYQLPRLKRMWTHLSRQKTGGGGTSAFRGSGEKQIEVDRRLLKARLTKLERELKEVRDQRATQRSARVQGDVPTFSIVGYTNAGKSTLLNALTEANVLAEDKLFATLDTTTRKYVLPNNQKILLIDTVGFIKKLPHTLVAAFRSTLEEVCFTDVVLHVVDVSHPAAMQHAQETLKVLGELGVVDKPIITILNKVDQCEDKSVLQQFRVAFPKTVHISALKREGFAELFQLIEEEIKNLRKIVKLRIPQSEYVLASELMREGRVIFSDYEENDILLEIEISAKLEHKVRPFYDRSSQTRET